MNTLLYLLVVVCAVALLDWLIAKLPTPPVPVVAKQIADAVVIVIAIICVLEVLTGGSGVLHIG